MKKSSILLAGLCITLGLTPLAQAKVTKQEADKLRTTLTPLGGERAGNTDGSIPEWRGGIQFPPVGYKQPGQHHVDPFPNDQPLFTITAQNMAKYEKYLTTGQKALFIFMINNNGPIIDANRHLRKIFSINSLLWNIFNSTA